MKPEHLFLWGHPRSLSTAMEVYFRARGDYQVIHEPFADAYWKGHSATQILSELLNRITTNETPIFVKDIAHHLPKETSRNTRLISSFSHFFLVRSPLAAFHSHLKVNPEVKDHEFGYQTLYESFRSIEAITGKAPKIMIADELLAAPEITIMELCNSLHIPHLPEALRWEAKEQSDWRAAQKWQAKASASRGFERSKEMDLEPLPAYLKPVFEVHQDSYLKLLEIANQQKLARNNI